MSDTFPKILCKDAKFLLAHKMCAKGTQISEMAHKIKFRGHFLSIHVYEICLKRLKWPIFKYLL